MEENAKVPFGTTSPLGSVTSLLAYRPVVADSVSEMTATSDSHAEDLPPLAGLRRCVSFTTLSRSVIF